MNRKQLLQTLFALCASALFNTGCSNDELTSHGTDPESDETSVVFNLGLPLGDEVNYTRATLADDDTEWAVKTMKVYHFATAVTVNPTTDDYTLVSSYDLAVTPSESAPAAKPGSGQCLSYGDGNYQLRISLRSNAIGANSRHKFVVVANDVCDAFDKEIADAADVSSIKLSRLRSCVADKQMTETSNVANLFMGTTGGLCMTGETGDLTLEKNHNDFTSNESNTITLTRIMARLDVKSFVSSSKVFVLKSVALKYSDYYTAPKGYLFAPDPLSTANNIWYDATRERMEVTQNTKYNEIGYPNYSNITAPEWVAETQKTVNVPGGGSVVRSGTWYKKVLYMYPYPAKIGNVTPQTPKIVLTYTLNGSEGTREVEMKDVLTLLPFDIKPNYVYTLQVGDPSASSENLDITFVLTPWTLHEIDADLNGGTDVP